MITPQPIGGQQLFLALLERIERGHYAPGSWLPAERSLAQEFGLDRSAVRRALIQLEGRGLIVRELGKRPWVKDDRTNGSRNSDGEHRQRTAPISLRPIVAILPHHPIYAASMAVLHGINTTLRSQEAPFRLQIIDTHGGNESRETSLEEKALESVVREEIAGVMLWHMGGTQTLPQLRELEIRGTPVVFIDRYPSELVCDFVGSDNQAGVEAAVEYLRALGHRRIAHLTTDEQSTAVLERVEAFTETMLNSHMTPRPEWVFKVPHGNTTDVASAYDQFFALSEPPTAVFAMNDSLAYQFIMECERRGTSVPGDISVIGFDDLERNALRPAILTTLHQPFNSMGRRAAGLLLRRLAGRDAARSVREHILLPTPLIKRSTCQSPCKDAHA